MTTSPTRRSVAALAVLAALAGRRHGVRRGSVGRVGRRRLVRRCRPQRRAPERHDQVTRRGEVGWAGRAGPTFHQQDVFHLGDGPRGPVLYRQSVIVLPGVSRFDTAVNGLGQKPDLPAYRTEWKPRLDRGRHTPR